jgi:hypothetical protein
MDCNEYVNSTVNSIVREHNQPDYFDTTAMIATCKAIIHSSIEQDKMKNKAHKNLHGSSKFGYFH